MSDQDDYQQTSWTWYDQKVVARRNQSSTETRDSLEIKQRQGRLKTAFDFVVNLLVIILCGVAALGLTYYVLWGGH